jgi:hypothetical protein
MFIVGINIYKKKIFMTLERVLLALVAILGMVLLGVTVLPMMDTWGDIQASVHIPQTRLVYYQAR